jgi:hypothetical protein
MKRSVIALISLAVIGLSGAAFAADTAKPAAMSDAQMDAVTAGDPGNGKGFAGDGFGPENALLAKLPGNNSHPGGNSDFGHNH